MNEDRLPSIDKLHESNWPVWKLQIKTYLEARELWSLFTRDETEPTAPGDGDDVAAYAEQSAKYQVRVARVKSILLQVVSTSQLHLIVQQHLRTPAEMWSELTGTIERPSLSDKLLLLTGLLHIKMEPSSSVDCYFKQL